MRREQRGRGAPRIAGGRQVLPFQRGSVPAAAEAATGARGTAAAAAALVAIACCVAGATLALHFPVAPTLVLVAFVSAGIVSAVCPRLALGAIPALLPITGFATWTGGFTFEELDLIVLAVATGGYVRVAAERAPSNGTARLSRDASIAVVLAAAFAVSSMISLWRGTVDAGGLQFDWIGGYDSPMNGVRLGKSFFLALLMLPLLYRQFARHDRRTTAVVVTGLCIGLAGASIAALWERVAFTDLLNFSTDYRTTGPFWEMQVGGAALDGFLALTIPFATWPLLHGRRPLQIASGLVLCMLAAYAALTTFSRGLYLALPISLVFLIALQMRRRRIELPTAGRLTLWRCMAGAVVVAVGAHYTFQAGGYRALAATLGALAIALTLVVAPGLVTRLQAATAFVAGLVACSIGYLISLGFEKGPYLVYAAVFALNVALALRTSATAGLAIARIAAYAWLCAAAALAAIHWGGPDALGASVAVTATLAVAGILAAYRGASPFPAAWRARAVLAAGSAIISAIVAVFAGCAYMSGRFSTLSDDAGDRWRHWSDGISMLNTADAWWLGRGLGRFPANYLFGSRGSVFPGSYALKRDGGSTYLLLAGPSYPTSWGDVLRIAQRVPLIPGHYGVSLQARNAERTDLHLEVCAQHLLYNGACATGAIALAPSPAWRTVSLDLDGHELSSGRWFAPKLGMFAIAVGEANQRVEVRNVTMIGPGGVDVLANGDFGAGMARWFIVSERYHLPWHIKNLALAVLYDQGMVGLLLFAALVLLALWRLTFGVAAAHALAPFLAAAIIGFVVVGMADSLLDVPRLAFMFYFCLAAVFALPRPSPAFPGSVPHPGADRRRFSA